AEAAVAWLPRPYAAAAGGVLLAVLAVNALAPAGYWWQPLLPAVAPGAPLARLEGNAALLRYELPHASARPGEAVSLTLHWTATGRLAHNLRVFVHLVGPDGQVWGQSDKFHPGEFVDLPTGRWPPGYVLADTHTAYLAPEAPPGQYEVRVGL